MSQKSIDVLVIGSGVIGSAIAYHLARRGQRVLVIECAEAAVAPAASWASAGGVRRQGRHPAEAELATEAIACWQCLAEQLGANLHYSRGGNLRLAETEAEAEQLVTFVRQQQALGFADVRLVDRQEVLALAPGLNDRVIAGSYSPLDGQADPVRTTRAFVAAAKRHGAVFCNDTLVVDLLTDGDRVIGVRTEHAEVQAGHVVLAAGAWSDELAATVGLRLPMRTRALQMLLSSPAPATMLRPVLSAVGRTLSLKQLPDGSFLIGGGWQGNVTSDRCSYTLRPSSVQANWATACELLPAVSQQRITLSWCGLEAQSIDGIPFVGSMMEGLTIAAGFSGHGFALAPALGRSIADSIAGYPTPELEGLSPHRIANFSPDQIEAFINEPATAAVLNE